MDILTGADLGQRLRISQAMVSRLRSGQRKPSYRLMVRIAEHLEWPIEDQVAAAIDGSYADRLQQKLGWTKEKSNASTG